MRGLIGRAGPGVLPGHYPALRFRESPDVLQEYQITQTAIRATPTSRCESH